MKKGFEKFLENKGISTEDYKAKTDQEKADLFSEYQEEAFKKINDAISDKQTKEQVNELIAEALKEAKDFASAKDVSKMEKRFEDLEEDIAQLKESGSSGPSANNWNSVLRKALEKALPTLKKWKQESDGQQKEIVLEIKEAVNITTGAIENASGETTPVSYVYQQVTDYAVDVRPEAYIINFMDNGTTDRASIPFMDKLPNEGTMEITEEGALKPLISISFELRYSTADKIAGRVKISEEALDDIPGLMTTINNELRYEHDIAQQDWIFTKINSIAPAFVAGDLAGTTDNPSNYDALRAAIYAVKIASKGRYMPNAALVPSADVYAMGATKDANNNYVLPPFVLPDGTKVSGVQVVEVMDEDTVAAGSFIVGDFRKLKRRVYKSFTVRIGQGINSVTDGETTTVQSDFESNMYTVIGESRQHLYIYENEKVAFVKSTFAAVKTAIETVEPEP